MSILETFLILFDSDTSDAKKGKDEVDKMLDDLEDKVHNTDDATVKLGESFMQVAKQAAGMLAAFVSVNAMISGFFSAVNIADQLDETAGALGMNVEELSAWGQAAKLAGGSTESLVGSLQSMQANLATLDATGKSKLTPFFKELGISATNAKGDLKQPLDIFLELADAFQNMSRAESIGFGRKLGLDIGTIMLLQQGRRSIEDVIARQKELGIVTKEQAEISALFHDELDNTQTTLRALGLTIAEYILPPITAFLKGLQQVFIFLRENSGWLEVAAIGVGILASVIMVRLVPSLWAAIAPFWPWIAILTLAAIVVQDLIYGILGFDSVSGRVFKKIRPHIEPAIQAFKDLYEWVDKVINRLKNFFGMDNNLAMKANTEENRKILLQQLQEGQDQGAGNEKRMSFDDYMDLAKKHINYADKTPLSSLSGSSITNAPVTKDYRISIGDIRINTQATDAEGIAQSFGQALERQSKQALSTFDDGLRI